MLSVRHRTAAGSVFAAILLVALLPAASFADSVATTSPASSITFTSAVLNGLANPSTPNSVYAFQYGTTTAYGQNTAAHQIGAGSQNVSETVSGLAPATTYHFRLVVVEGSYPSTAHTGADLVFTTPALNSVATTGNATSVTNNSAVLNGVVNTTNPDSAWAFQYGTTSAYGKFTKPQTVGTGVTAVGVKITGLKRKTKYHFRLVVVQGSYPAQFSTGSDVAFKTNARAFGVLSLRKTTLRVSHGRLAVPLKCTGIHGALCKGRLSVSIAVAKGKRVRCIGGGFSAKAVKKFVLRRKVRAGCLSLLARATGHRAGATLAASFSTNQSRFKSSVVVLG